MHFYRRCNRSNLSKEGAKETESTCHICRVLILAPDPGSDVVNMLSCVKSSHSHYETLCKYVSTVLCATNLLFSLMDLTSSAFYSCAHCQWHEKLHEETFLHARQCCRFFWGSPLAAWYHKAHLRELFWAVWGPAGRKPEFSGFQDWKCQLVPEPGQWFLCQPCRWPNLAGITARQPFPFCDLQNHWEKEDFYWQ